MRKLLLLSLTSMLATSLPAADSDSQTAVTAAAKQLADKPNYSWTSTPRSEPGSVEWRQGPLQGKTEKDGYSFFSLTVGDNTVECAFKGAKSAIKIEGDWEGAEELTGDREWIAGRLKAFKAPAAEASDLVSKVKDLKQTEGGPYAGDLTEDGLKALLSTMIPGRRGGQAPDMKNAKAWAKFWLKDGALTKYEFNIQGKFTGRDGDEVNLNRTTAVEIKDVGATKVQVPEDAKKKLS
jgi:hypothetical protein